MRARNYKSKALKEKDNYATSSNVMSESFYMTETNDSSYHYRSGRGSGNKKDDYYKYYEDYDPRRSSETLTNIVDYTSASSSDERDARNRSPGSKSEKIYPRRYSDSPRQRRRNQSPRGYETQEEDRKNPRERNRNRLGSASEQTLGYSRRRSPKREIDDHYVYYDLSYKKYFEPTEKRVRERSLEHTNRQRRILERAEREFMDRKERVQKSHKQQREYQVYAYENAKPNTAFMGKAIDNGNSDLPSEIELKNHEYPIIVFKDKNPPNKDRNVMNAKNSDMIYVPVLVMDKSNKKINSVQSPVNNKPITQENNFQVYAANLENKNYFKTMGEANLKEKFSGSNKRQSLNESSHSPNKYSTFDNESHLESILNQTEYNFKPTDSNFSPNSGTQNKHPPSFREPSKLSKETTATRNPFGNNQKSIVYQVNVDATTGMEIDSIRKLYAMNKNDHLHDDYPVTKDYIKVNSSEERKLSNVGERQGSVVKPTRQSTKSGSRNPSVIVDVITNENISNSNRNPSAFVDVITNKNNSHSISDGKDATRHKSIVKGSFIQRNQSIAEENLPKKSSAVGNRNTQEKSSKRSVVEAKSGSLAIPFDVQTEDGSDVRSTQGLTRLSSGVDGSEKQGLERQSTKDNFVRQSNIVPLTRKSTVSHRSIVASVAKLPSITKARESQAFEKKLPATQSRISPDKSHNASLTPIAETTLESKKSSVREATTAQTKPSIPARSTSIELRQSLVQTQKADEAAKSGQRKSKVSTQYGATGKSSRGTLQNLGSEEALTEFTYNVAKEQSITKASLGRIDGTELGRTSETPPAPFHDEPQEEYLKKSEAFDYRKRDQRVLSGEKLTSVVNFSQSLEKITPSDKESFKNYPIDETMPHTNGRKSLKRSATPEVEDFGKVAQYKRPSEPKKSDSKKSKPTTDQPTVQKQESDPKPKSLWSRLSKKKSRSNHDMKPVRSKSVVSKRSKSVAKEKKTDAKKAPSKGFLGILKRSKSSLSNKSRTSSKEVMPSEERQGTKNSEKRTGGSTKPKQTQPEQIPNKQIEPEPCQCKMECLNMVRECGDFFIGLTLFQQILKILEIFSGPEDDSQPERK